MEILMTLVMLAFIAFGCYAVIKRLKKISNACADEVFGIEEKIDKRKDPLVKAERKEFKLDVKKKKPKKARKKREVYHVTPNKGEGWNLKRRGEKTGEIFTRKSDAVKEGRKRAKSSGLGQLVVHKKDGTIQAEYTYGEDPKSSKG